MVNLYNDHNTYRAALIACGLHVLFFLALCDLNHFSPSLILHQSYDTSAEITLIEDSHFDRPKIQADKKHPPHLVEVHSNQVPTDIKSSVKPTPKSTHKQMPIVHKTKKAPITTPSSHQTKKHSAPPSTPIHRPHKLSQTQNQDTKIDKRALERMLQQQIQAEEAHLVAHSREIQAIALYKQRLLKHIGSYWRIPPNVGVHQYCELQLKIASDGTVLQVRIIHSSGHAALDHSAEIAVLKASPLPVPHDKQAFRTFRNIHLIVQPEKVMSPN